MDIGSELRLGIIVFILMVYWTETRLGMLQEPLFVGLAGNGGGVSRFHGRIDQAVLVVLPEPCLRAANE
jgi:hypothetical protein